MVLFGLILIFMTVLAFITHREVGTTRKQESIADSIVQGTNELSYLANDYLIYRESQQLSRWQSRFASFSNQVAALNMDSPEQQVLLRNIQVNEHRLKEVFNSLVSAAGASSASQEALLDPAQLQVSWSRIAIQSQGLISDASRLSQLLHQQMDHLVNRRTLLLYFMMGMFGALLLSSYMMTSRRILKSLARLRADTAIIGSGNLDFRIEENSKDEVGDLSRAFNQMTADLKTVTASKADLEREMAERKQAEEALKKAHDELEKRVQERTHELSEAVERLQLEIIQRKKLEATLRESESQVRFFASQYLTAQETERKRIAGELHDSIAASLAAIRLRIERMAEETKKGLSSADSLQDIASRVAEINTDVRSIMADLRPSILDDLGILAALNWFCREYQKTYSHISVDKQIGIEEQEVPDSLKTPIFRISQEAMTNTSKHSQASLIRLSLQRENDKIVLTIQDNGQGFALDAVKKGLGLSTMKERAQLSGGYFDLESAAKKGTIVRISWPN
jgi:signal transduction histidine kinase